MFFTGVGIKCAPEQRHPAGNKYSPGAGLGLLLVGTVLLNKVVLLFLNKRRLVIGIMEYIFS